MKAKANITEKSGAAPARPRQIEIEEPVTSGFSFIEEIMPFLGLGPAPSAGDCEDMSERTYRRARALTEYMECADKGFRELGQLVESPAPWFADALKLQIELGRLTAKRLFILYHDDLAAQSQKSA